MPSTLILGRKLATGETPPASTSNEIPLHVDADGRLLVAVEGVAVELPGGVQITSPLAAEGGLQVETKAGTPLYVVFDSAPDMVLVEPIGALGGVVVEPAATSVFKTEFASAQEVTFPSPQQVEFAAPQQVSFAAAQEVVFPSAQDVVVTGPVTANGGLKVENTAGTKLSVDYGGAIPEVTFAPGLSDGFSRLRVSNPQTMFETKFLYDKKPSIWGEILAGAGTATHGGNAPQVTMTVTAASGDRVVRQSYEYVPYQPGKGRLALLTGVMATVPKANCRARMGLFDDNADKTAGNDSGGDGTFFELNGTTMYCVVRSHVSGVLVEERTEQADWNIDKLDGSGPSGMIADWSKSQIFAIDLEWLGVGTVTFGIVLGRRLFLLHQFHHSNLIVGTYMRRADLPVRYELHNTGATSGATSMYQICCSVLSEGGYEPDGRLHAASLGTATKTVGGTETPIMAIRTRLDRVRSYLLLRELILEVTSNHSVLIKVYAGSGIALTNASWANVDATFSVAQVDSAATTFTGGILRYTSYITQNNRRVSLPRESFPLMTRTSIEGVPSPILITGQSLTTNATVLASIAWVEP
jgi:hypothetical protein